MATTFTLNGKSFQASPLSYGQVKTNADTFNQVVASGLDNMARTKASEAFLLVAGIPQEDLDAATPGELIAGAIASYLATFARPEVEAPAQSQESANA